MSPKERGRAQLLTQRTRKASLRIAAFEACDRADSVRPYWVHATVKVDFGVNVTKSAQ